MAATVAAGEHDDFIFPPNYAASGGLGSKQPSPRLLLAWRNGCDRLNVGVDRECLNLRLQNSASCRHGGNEERR
jgi:hypothetical protein